MSKPFIDKLKKIAPGFVYDKDDEWVRYLPTQDRTRLGKWREKYLAMMEPLEELKLTKNDKAIEEQSKKLANEVDNFMQSVLFKELPRLKEQAIKERENAIRNDFASSNKRPKLDGEANGESEPMEYLLDFADFLPNTMVPERQKSPEPNRKRNTTEQANEPQHKQPQQPAKNARDAYFDGVADEFHLSLLTAFRPIIEKYQCRPRVIEALESCKLYDDTIDIFNHLKMYTEKYKPPTTKSN